MNQITVCRIDGLETILGCNFCTTNFTSLRQFSQIYCEFHNIHMNELGDTPVSEIMGWAHEFFAAIRSEAVDTTAETTPIAPMKPLTISLMIELEDAIGVPFYGGMDLDKISTQLICVEKCYGLNDHQMAVIRDMDYSSYVSHVWEPLKSSIIRALSPTTSTAAVDEGEGEEVADNEKNQYEN